ncbi:hypothetical protein C8R21_10964 [Nitrosospira multiformis]|uniref:Uncharacterized protein n=1 Tax=Nitrosospira multiformis TaxID=1231 RepID=A0A2T5ICF4_9PROT|nr:hypothetical protein C8R21_10964 [Nitrosospira multiformis]
MCRSNTDLVQFINHISHRIYPGHSGTMVPVDNQFSLPVAVRPKLNRELGSGALAQHRVDYIELKLFSI